MKEKRFRRLSISGTPSAGLPVMDENANDVKFVYVTRHAITPR